MKHKKEWHTCDRCGCEIEEMPMLKNFLTRKLMSPAEYKIQYGEVKGYISNLEMLTEDLIGVQITECENVKTKYFDLCPKCKKDFERFMENA